MAPFTVRIAATTHSSRRRSFTREQLPLRIPAKQQLRQNGPSTASCNGSDLHDAASDQRVRHCAAGLRGAATARFRSVRTKHMLGSGKRRDCHRPMEFGFLARGAAVRSTIPPTDERELR